MIIEQIQTVPYIYKKNIKFGDRYKIIFFFEILNQDGFSLFG